MNYRYKVRDKHGKAISGTMTAEDKNGVAKHLSAMGYVPISIEEAKDTIASGNIGKFLEIFKPVTLEDTNLFTRQLLTLQKAGIPLLASLTTLEKQTKNAAFKVVLKEVAAYVEGGMSLSDALAKYPKIFTSLYVNMVKAGEASGQLDEILGRLADFGERDLDTRQRITAATRYPLITLGALVTAFLIVVNFVIPKFAAVFAQFKTDLPLPTRVLLGLSYAMRTYWYLCIIGVGLVVYAFIRYINTPQGRLRLDAFALNAPAFGKLVSMFTMSRFSRTMSILMKSGLPILQVLDLTSRTVGNAVVSRTIDTIAVSVREGKGIAEPMRVSGIFPPIVINMVAIGEETGKVDELLMRVSEYYDQQSDYMVKNMTTLIEPLFVFILGIMVLVMALAIFLPMWNLITLFRH